MLHVYQCPLGDRSGTYIRAFTGFIDMPHFSFLQVLQKRSQSYFSFSEDEVVYTVKFFISGGKKRAACYCFHAQLPAAGDYFLN